MDGADVEFEALAELLTLAFLSVMDERSARYVAGPLTTGRRYYEDLMAARLRPEVIRQSNEMTMRSFARSLRQNTSLPIIDSGVLRVPQWSPSQHGRFFLRVVAQFCRDIIFVDEWEFSAGATKEFVFAQEHRIRCVDRSENEITMEDGRTLIVEAAALVRRAGGPVEMFERRLAALKLLERPDSDASSD